MSSKNLLIKSFGCQMNVYDATRMADALVHEGYAETTEIDAADLVILNTCHIRERASEKIFSELGRLNEHKNERAARGMSTIIAVAGCVAQADGAEIIRRQPAVDIVIGTQSYHRLPEALELARVKSGVVLTDLEVDSKFERLKEPTIEKIKSRGVTSFVTIQEGCDKFCSFCVVPYTRGIETSRPISKIIQEIERLALAGVREVTLLGQNVNAYHGVDEGGKATSLPRLIERIAKVSGIDRIRYTTSHPSDMSDELIEAHRDISALMPFIHLPVQSGSDKILKVMNRKHAVREYMDIVDRLRVARPDIAISSDFIVGFPGESREDFEETLALVRHVGFSSSYSFKFSARPGTPASSLENQVAESLKVERLAELQCLLEHQRKAFNRSLLDKTVEILVEKRGRYDTQIIGKTPHLQAVFADGSIDLIGSSQRVEILEMSSNSFRGKIVNASAQ